MDKDIKLLSQIDWKAIGEKIKNLTPDERKSFFWISAGNSLFDVSDLRFLSTQPEFKLTPIQTDELFEKVLSVSKAQDYLPLSYANTKGVTMREYVIVKADDDKHIAATHGAGPCIGLALYNPLAKIAAVAHFDISTDLASLNTMIFETRGTKDIPLQAHLVGGQNVSREQMAKIIKILEEQNCIIKTAAVFGSQAGAIAIDAHTGKVTNEVNPHAIDSGRNLYLRLQIVAITSGPLKKVREDFYMPVLPKTETLEI